MNTMKLWLTYILSTCFIVHVYSQSITPTSDENTLLNGLCLTCNVQNTANAYDGNTTSFATFDASSLAAGVLGFVSHDFLFPANIGQGDQLTLVMSFADVTLLNTLTLNDLASATVFDQLEIELIDGTTSVASYGRNYLATVHVLDPNTATFQVDIIVPSADIDKIRVKNGALVSLGASPSILHVHDIIAAPMERYYTASFLSKTIDLDGLICANCDYINENNAMPFSNDPNFDYSCFIWPVGLVISGNPTISARYDWGGAPNSDFLGDTDGKADAIVVEMGKYSLATVGLNLGGLDILTQDGIAVEVGYTDATSAVYDNTSSALSVHALGSNAGKFNLVFEVPPSKTVDYVEVTSKGGTADVGSELRVYNIYSAPASVALPVEMAYFSAQKQDKAVQLEWLTETEKNSAYFEVYRSTDGLSFSPIAKLQAAGDSDKPRIYGYRDEALPQTQWLYYRLKQIDTDGRFVWSEVKVIERTLNNEVVQVYPQPSNHNIFIQTNPDVEIQNIELFNAQSQKIDSPFQSGVGLAEVKLNNVPAGLYILRIHTDRGTIQQQIMHHP